MFVACFSFLPCVPSVCFLLFRALLVFPSRVCLFLAFPCVFVSGFPVAHKECNDMCAVRGLLVICCNNSSSLGAYENKLGFVLQYFARNLATIPL